MDSVNLYSAFAKINPSEPFKFELEELEIKKIYDDGTIELKHPYFISSNYSTYHFGGKLGEKLDKVYEINDYMTVLYSMDKQKCKDFLISKRKEVTEKADNLLKRLNQSKIEDLTNNEDFG